MKIMKLDNETKVPLYIQLYNEIKNLILEGSLAAHTKLPSKKNLMAEYNLSQNTVQNALALLIEEGYVYSEERKGYFVENLENLLLKSIKNKQKTEHIQKEKILYDFSYSGVDPELFPKNIFKKITKEIYEENNKELTFQGHIQGYEELRQSIVQYLTESRGFETDASRIIISSGTEYLFHIIFKLFKVQKYALENPGYPMLPQLLSSNEISFSAIPLDQFGMIPQALVSSQANIACITPSHQFPTGIIMPMPRRQELLQWANEKENRYIIEDDYDSEFKYTGRPIPALKSIDYQDKIIYIGSFSKSISPSMRVSYMVLPQKLLEIYQKKIPYFICPVSTLNQKILYKFIQEGYFVKHLNRMRTLYKKKREFLISCLQEKYRNIFGEELEIQGADAGLHLIVSLPLQESEEEFLEDCKKYGLKIYPLRNYYLKTFPQKSFFLLGYASLNKQEMEKGISLMLSLLHRRK